MVKYRFQMQGVLPKSCNSRPISFLLRREVREQIEEMIKNGILEISHSPYVNPLTINQRKHKPVRICVHAMQVNKQTYRTERKHHQLMNYYTDFTVRSSFLL